MRKLIHYLNFVFVSIAAIGALFFGEKAMLVYFYLAAFQLLTGFIILVANCMTYNNDLPEILIYWVLVLLYFIAIPNIVPNDAIRLLIIPILIAMFHCYTTYKFTKL